MRRARDKSAAAGKQSGAGKASAGRKGKEGSEPSDSFTLSIPKPSRQLLVGIGIGMGVAVGAAVLVLVLSRDNGDGGDEPAADAAVEQLALAGDTAQLSEQVGEHAEGLTSGAGAGVSAASAARIRDQANRLIAEADAATENTAPARLLVAANEDNLAASREIEAISSELTRGTEKLAADEVASEEASEEASELSDRMDALSPRLEQARRSLQGALSQLRQAVRQLGAKLRAEGKLSEADASEQLTQIHSNLRALARESRQSFLAAAAGAGELSEGLAGRAEELEPDVVLDCPDPAFPSLIDLSVRNISCEEGLALVNSVPSLDESFTVSGYSCALSSPTSETAVVHGAIYGGEFRCSSGDQAFRFSYSE